MKGYHLSYLMKRAGLLMAAALVSSQVLGCCSWCRFDTEVGGKWSVWNVKVPVAPENRYARGDGETDDTQAIQDHIDAARNAGGGIVFFPQGKYRITSSLYLWGGVYIKGIGGATFGTEYFDGLRFGDVNSREAFVNRLSCAIVLDRNAGTHTNIIVTDSLLYLSGVENIALVGSRDVSDPYDTTSNQGCGIYMRKGVPFSRSQAEFRNVLIYATKGIGFYEGANQHEAFLNHVMALQCGHHGFEFNGTGNRVERCGAGGNMRCGFSVRGSGSDRFYDIDTWKNWMGVEVNGCRDVSFVGLNANDNENYGVWLGPEVGDYSRPASQVEIYRGDFSGNRLGDISLNSSRGFEIGPSGVLIHGCVFRGGPSEFPISDKSLRPIRNVVSNCTFHVYGYAGSNVINKTNIYLFRDCIYLEKSAAGVYANNSMQCKMVPPSLGEYYMKPYDGHVVVDTKPTVTKTVIFLPDTGLVQTGTIYYVTKASGSGVVVINGFDDQRINARSNVGIKDVDNSVMISRVIGGWIGVKMVAP